MDEQSCQWYAIRAAERLIASGQAPDDARRDAALLARWTLGWDVARWLVRSTESAPAEFAPAFEAVVARRAAGEPIAYLLGTREFYGRPFKVTPAVLIPRPETELVIDQALEALAASGRPGGLRRTAVDVGTGSGCLAITLAIERPDLLVVAINDDASVRGLKGAGRPILGEADRAELVAALRGVDYVVLFPEPTVTPLLLAVKPDVHCKGTDYTVDTVPERETVRGYGGRIAIVGDPKDHSTRDLLARIRGQ